MLASKKAFLASIAAAWVNGLPVDNQAYDSAALLQKGHTVKTINDVNGKGELLQILKKSRSSDEMQDVLEKHNEYRCRHGVELMTWDDEIAANAQQVADAGVFAHSSQASRQGVAGFRQLGENIAWGWPTRTGTDSTEAWYAEIEDTVDGLGTPSSCSDGVDGKAVCHYTQVVWKSSTKLGCGKGSVDGGDFWVCQYGSGGNVNGQFEECSWSIRDTRKECQSGSGSNGASPTPSPDITEETTDPDCEDGSADDDPVIVAPNSQTGLECSALGWACELYGFVTAKCRQTCNAC